MDKYSIPMKIPEGCTAKFLLQLLLNMEDNLGSFKFILNTTEILFSYNASSQCATIIAGHLMLKRVLPKNIDKQKREKIILRQV
jgi:hypothetical protein